MQGTTSLHACFWHCQSVSGSHQQPHKCRGEQEHAFTQLEAEEQQQSRQPRSSILTPEDAQVCEALEAELKAVKSAASRLEVCVVMLL